MSDNSKALAIVPRDITEFSSLADRFAKSTLIPSDLRAKPEDVFVTLLAGQELGLAPMASLRAIHVVKGKPILSADAMVAVVLGRGACEYFTCIEESDASVTYETKRTGAPHPQRSTWTMADAKRAKLDGGDNWTKYPRAMLKARCKAALARDVYPDVLAGCYEESEAAEFTREAASAPRPAIQPQAKEPDAIDVEVVERVVPWAAFCAEFGAPATASEDDIAEEWSKRLDCATAPEINEAIAPIGAALSKHKADARVAALRVRLTDMYKARLAELRGAA